MGTIPAVPTFPAGQVVQGASLQTLCTALTWCFSGRPLTRLQQGVTQSISNTTLTAITWDTKVVDRDSGWSSGSNTRYTAQTPGIYLVSANIVYAVNATGDRQIVFRVTTGANNPLGSSVTTQFGYSSVPAPGTAGHNGMAASKMLTPYMYDADYVEVLTQQNSGGALSTSITGEALSFFDITLVSG